MKEWTKEEIDSVCELVGGNPDEIIRQLQSRLEELNQKVEELENEMQEQCRIIGMSAERELSLISKMKSLEKENASLKPDASRLDWLDSQVKRHVVCSGYAWQEAGYESDRGLVCMIQGKRDRMSARQAIDTAIQDNK